MPPAASNSKYDAFAGLVLLSPGAVRVPLPAVAVDIAVDVLLGPSTTVSATADAPGHSLLGHALVSLASKLADDFEKGLFHINAVLGRRLDKVTAEQLRQGAALLGRDLALGDAVALVSDEHDGRWAKGRAHGRGRERRAGIGRGAGERVLLDALDLVVEALDAGEGGARRDAVDEDEALAVAYPLVSQRNVLLLAGGVEHLEHARLAVDLHLLSVRVFNGGVVGLDEVVQTELPSLARGEGNSGMLAYLDGQGGLADAAVAQHHQLV